MSSFKNSKNSKNSKNNNKIVTILNYSLHNKDNYKPLLDSSIMDIMNKYTKLVFEYLLFITENIVTKNEKYNKFIIYRGLGTITHVFSSLLFYSNNLDISYYHSQKSFYFYVEFIGQISEDQHSFLQLSSRDASIFVYKKTIFDMNTELKETISNADSLKNKKILEVFDIYKSIIQNLIYKKILNEIDFKNSKEEKKNNLTKKINYIENITETILNHKINIENLNSVYYFIEKLDKCDTEEKNYYLILETFIKKYLNNQGICKNINDKIIDTYIFKFLNDNQTSANKFISTMIK
uniref:Uncharacterized protein n=1 Tax=viral metagenome TaxID=1070528 RepID=A0A6C0KUJ0_9ZZZZ